MGKEIVVKYISDDDPIFSLKLSLLVKIENIETLQMIDINLKSVRKIEHIWDVFCQCPDCGELDRLNIQTQSLAPSFNGQTAEIKVVLDDRISLGLDLVTRYHNLCDCCSGIKFPAQCNGCGNSNIKDNALIFIEENQHLCSYYNSQPIPDLP